MTATISYNTFTAVDIRVGKIISVSDFPEARNPSYKLKIDFGRNIGIKRSCAQLTTHYTKESLIEKRILGVVNFEPKQIGPTISEVLVVGVSDEEGNAVLVSPDTHKGARLGSKLF